VISTGRFSRSDRLRDSRDYQRVSRTGRRSASRYFVVLRAPSGDAGSKAVGPCERVRLGITVSRKVGNAVKRNYIKRCVREWFRLRRSSELSGDVVVIARRDAATLRGSGFTSALDELSRDMSR